MTDLTQRLADLIALIDDGFADDRDRQYVLEEVQDRLVELHADLTRDDRTEVKPWPAH